MEQDSFFQPIIDFVYYIIVDYIIFILIDIIIKECLKAAGSIQEKRKIYFVELCCLSVLSLIIHLTHHTPVIIYTLALCIAFYLLFTQQLTSGELRRAVVLIFRFIKWHLMYFPDHCQRGWRKLKRQGVDAVFPTKWLTTIFNMLCYVLWTVFVCAHLLGHLVLRWIITPLWGSQLVNKAYAFLTSKWTTSCHGAPYGLASRLSGNLCFLYSVLQCLLHTPRLSAALRDVSCRSYNFKDARILNILCALFKRADEDVTGPLDISELTEALSGAKGIPHIVYPTDQPHCDAFELFSGLLNIVHKETRGDLNLPIWSPCAQRLRLVHSVSFNGTDDWTGLSEDAKNKLNLSPERDMASFVKNWDIRRGVMRLADLEWVKARDRSGMRTHYELQTMSVIHCPKCKKVRSISESMIALPVALPATLAKSPINLQDRITENYQRIDSFDDLQCFYCNYEPSQARREAVKHHGNGIGEMGLKAPDAVNVEEPLSPIARPIGGDPVGPSGPCARILSSLDDEQKTSTPIRAVASNGELRNIEKQTLLGNLPSCLVIHLLRFKYTEEGSFKTTKNCIPLIVPLQLDLKGISWMDTPHATTRYRLCGVVVHYGSLSRGHYISLIRYEPKVGTPQSEESRTGGCGWYLIDDASVKPIDDIKATLNSRSIMENSYLLFYSAEM